MQYLNISDLWSIKLRFSVKKYLFICLLLFGCAVYKMPADFQYRQIKTNGFDISVWQKIGNPQSLYYVYIEGDGNAFNAYGQPTSDPTPKSDFMRKTAAENNADNVVYVARPCQFTKGAKCEQKYWTTARFSPEAVDAQYQAIKNIVGKNPVVLVGYSGGAQIAGLIAVTKDLNIKKIITIAGNLDHKAWTEYHHLPPLSESLNLADYQDKFFTFAQVHYVGQNDEVIPPVLTLKFVNNRAKVVKIPNAKHNSGWNRKQLLIN